MELDLTGVDGNAFAILAAFRRQAQKQGVEKSEIERVCKEAMSGDYDHLISTIMDYAEVI